MTQTKLGAIKAKQTLTAKYGENYFRTIGSTGGKTRSNATHLRGFGSNRELAAQMGRIGGSRSSRKGITNKSEGKTEWVSGGNHNIVVPSGRWHLSQQVTVGNGSLSTEAPTITPQHPINNSIWNRVFGFIKKGKK